MIQISKLIDHTKKQTSISGNVNSVLTKFSKHAKINFICYLPYSIPPSKKNNPIHTLVELFLVFKFIFRRSRTLQTDYAQLVDRTITPGKNIRTNIYTRHLIGQKHNRRFIWNSKWRRLGWRILGENTWL